MQLHKEVFQNSVVKVSMWQVFIQSALQGRNKCSFAEFYDKKMTYLKQRRVVVTTKCSDKARLNCLPLGNGVAAPGTEGTTNEWVKVGWGK